MRHVNHKFEPFNSTPLFQAAHRALDEAKSIDEVKDFRDKALAMEAYAFQAKDAELVAMAMEIKRRATRRIGELMAEMKAADKLAKGTRGGGRPSLGGSSNNPPKNDSPTLAEQGINKNLADSARKLAAMPDDKFEEETKRVTQMGAEMACGDKEVIAEIRAQKNRNKKERREAKEKALAAKITALPDKKFGVIYADPPWKFEFYSDAGANYAGPENHYPLSSTEDIMALPVAGIAADDCVLLLWATAPMMPHAFDVMEAWGFEYKSQVVWVKHKAATGFWFRGRHELLLLGTKGNVPAPAPGDAWESVVEAPTAKHSEKPKIIYDLIESYFPNLPKIELNARGQAREGWESWGPESAPRKHLALHGVERVIRRRFRRPVLSTRKVQRRASGVP